MFWSFLTTMTTDTHSNNANNSLQGNVYDESAFYDDFEPRNENNKNKPISHRILNYPEHRK